MKSFSHGTSSEQGSATVVQSQLESCVARLEELIASALRGAPAASEEIMVEDLIALDEVFLERHVDNFKVMSVSWRAVRKLVPIFAARSPGATLQVVQACGVRLLRSVTPTKELTETSLNHAHRSLAFFSTLLLSFLRQIKSAELTTDQILKLCRVTAACAAVNTELGTSLASWTKELMTELPEAHRTQGLLVKLLSSEDEEVAEFALRVCQTESALMAHLAGSEALLDVLSAKVADALGECAGTNEEVWRLIITRYVRKDDARLQRAIHKACRCSRQRTVELAQAAVEAFESEFAYLREESEPDKQQEGFIRYASSVSGWKLSVLAWRSDAIGVTAFLTQRVLGPSPRAWTPTRCAGIAMLRHAPTRVVRKLTSCLQVFLETFFPFAALLRAPAEGAKPDTTTGSLSARRRRGTARVLILAYLEIFRTLARAGQARGDGLSFCVSACQYPVDWIQVRALEAVGAHAVLLNADKLEPVLAAGAAARLPAGAAYRLLSDLARSPGLTSNASLEKHVTSLATHAAREGDLLTNSVLMREFAFRSIRNLSKYAGFSCRALIPESRRAAFVSFVRDAPTKLSHEDSDVLVIVKTTSSRSMARLPIAVVLSTKSSRSESPDPKRRRVTPPGGEAWEVALRAAFRGAGSMSESRELERRVVTLVDELKWR